MVFLELQALWDALLPSCVLMTVILRAPEAQDLTRMKTAISGTFSSAVRIDWWPSQNTQ